MSRTDTSVPTDWCFPQIGWHPALPCLALSESARIKRTKTFLHDLWYRMICCWFIARWEFLMINSRTMLAIHDTLNIIRSGIPVYAYTSMFLLLFQTTWNPWAMLAWPPGDQKHSSRSTWNPWDAGGRSAFLRPKASRMVREYFILPNCDQTRDQQMLEIGLCSRVYMVVFDDSGATLSGRWDSRCHAGPPLLPTCPILSESRTSASNISYIRDTWRLLTL